MGYSGCVGRSDSGANPLAGAQLVLTPALLPADGTSSAQVDVYTLDGDGNPLADVRVTLVGDERVALEQPTQLTDEAGHTTGRVVGLAAGEVTLHFTASVGGRTLSAPAAATLTLLAVDPHALAKLLVNIDPPVASVDVATQRAVTVLAQTAAGTPVAGAYVNLTTGRSRDTIAPAAGTTDATGALQTTLTSTLAGAADVTASSLSASSRASAIFLPGLPDPAHTYFFTLSGNAVAADGVTVTQAQVVVGDRYGNPVPYAPVSVAASAGNVALVPPSGTANATGVFDTTVITSDLGNTTLTANTGTTAVEHNVVLVPGPISATTSVFEVSPTVEPANGVSSMGAQVTLLDAAGHARVGDVVTWGSSDAQSVFVPATGITDSTGTAQTLVTSLAVGNVLLSATAGNTTFTVPVRYVAGPAAALTSTLVATPNSIVAGAAPGTTLSATLRDAYGHSVPNTTLVWSTSDATATLSSASSVTDAQGQATITVASSTRGTLRVTALFGASSLSTSVSVAAAAPDAGHSTLSLRGPAPLADNATPATLALILRDAFNNAVASVPVVLTIAGPNARIVPSAGATAADGTLSAQGFTTLAGMHSVTASWGQGSLSLPVSFGAGAPNAALSSLVATPNGAVADGTTSIALSVQLRDAWNNPCGGQALTLADGSASDALRPASGTSDASGTFAAALSGTVAGPRLVTARIGAVTLSAPVSLVAGAPDAAHSTLRAVPTSLVADGHAASLITVTLADLYGNPVVAPVQLSSSLDGVASLWRIGGTATQIGTTDVHGTLAASLAVTEATSFTVQASTGNLTLSTPLASSAGSADANHSTLSIVPQSLVAGTSATLSVSVRDAFGNPVPSATLALSASDANATILPASLLSDARGAAAASVRPIAAGTTQLTVTVTDSNGSFALTGNVVVSAAAPRSASSSLSVAPSYAVANGNSALGLSLAVRDAFGNPVPAFSIALASSTPGDVLLPQTLTTAADGTASAQWSATVAGGHTVSASGSNWLLSGAGNFVPGALSAAASTVTLVPAALVADGAQAATLALHLRDAFGNPLPAVPVTLGDGGSNVTFVPPSGVSDLQGNFAAQVTTTLAGVRTLTATAANTVFGVGMSAAPGSAAAATSALVVTPNVLVADGSASATATLSLRDAFGNPLGNAPVSFVCPGTTLSAPTATTDANGRAQISLGGTVAASRTLSASGNGLTLSAPVTLVAGPASAATSQLYATSSTAPANGVGAIAVTLLLRDAQGNLAPNTPVSFVSSSPNAVLSTSSGLTSSTGRLATSLTSSTPGALSLTASFVGVQGQNTLTLPLSFVPLDANNTLFVLSAAANVAVAGSATPLQIVALLTDGTGTPIPNQNVVFGGLMPSDTLSPFAGVTDAAGTIHTQLSSTYARPLMVLAQAANLTSAIEINIVAGAPNSATSSWVVTPNTLVADGQASATLALVVADAFNNPVTQANVTIGSTGGTVALALAGSVTDARGALSASATSTVSGQPTLSAQIGNLLLTAPVSFVAGPLSAASSAVVAMPNQVTADGVSTLTLLADARDALGNPRPSARFDVALPAHATGVTGLPQSGVCDASGNLMLPLRATVAQQLALSVVLDNVPFAVTVQFVAGAPNATQSTWTGPTTGIVADGNAQGTFVLTLRDALGNPVPGLTATAGDSDGNVHLLASTQTTAADGTASFVVSATRSGSSTVQVSAGNVTLGAPLTWVAGPATSAQSTLQVSGAPAVADTVTPVTLTLFARDAFGNPAAGAPVTLSTTTGQLVLYDAAAQQSAAQLLSGVTNAAGMYQVTATSSVAEGKGVLASVGQALLMQNFVMVAGAPNSVTSTLSVSPAQTSADGGSQATLVLTARDAFFNPVPGAQVIFAESGQADVLQPVNATTNAAGMATSALSSTFAESKPVSAALGNVVLQANALFVAGPASNATSSLSVVPQTIVADGTSRAQVTLVVRDAAGNAASGRLATLSGPGLSVSPSSGLSDGNGVWQSQISGTTAGNILLSAAVDNIVLFAPLSLLAGPPDPAHSTLSVTPNVVVADGTSQGSVLLTAADRQGNPVVHQLVTLTSSGNCDVLGRTSGTTNAVGQWSTTIATTLAGTKTLTATVQNVQLQGSVTFVAGAPDANHSLFVATPNQVTADGISQATLSLVLRDAQSNLVAQQPVTLSAPGAQLSTPAASTDGSGQLAAQLSSTLAGPVIVTLSAGPTSLSVPVSFVAGPPSLSSSTLLATPSQATADGNQTLLIVARARDAFNNPVANQTVSFSASGVLNTLSAASALTDATGTAQVTIASRRAQSERVSAVFAGLGLSTQISFVPGSAAAGFSSLSVAPNSIVADGQSLATVTLRVADALGNPEPNQTASLSVGGSNNTLQTATLTTGSDGSATASFASIVAEPKQLTAQLQNFSLSSQANFVPGPPAAATTVFGASPTLATADGLATVTLMLVARDAFGNATPNQAVALSVDGSANQLGSAGGSTDSAGQFTTTLVSTYAQLKHVTATVGGVSQSVAVSFVAGPLSPATSTLLLSPNHVLADGNSLAEVQLVANDAQGNPLTGQTVQFVSSGGAADLFARTSGTTDATGTASTELRSTLAGARTLSASINQGSLSGALYFYPGAPSSLTSTLVISPASVVADGNSFATLSVLAEDAFGNPVGNQTVGIAASGAGVQLVPAGGQTSPSGTFAAQLGATVAENKVVTVSLGSTTLTGNVTFQPGPPSSVTSSLVAVPPANTADGNSPITLSLVLKDALGNPVGSRGISLSVSGTRNTLSAAGGLTDSTGALAVQLTSTRSETKTVVATTAGMSLSTTATFLPGAPSLQSTSLSVAPNNVAADAPAAPILTLMVADAQGNPVGYQNANFTSSYPSDVFSQASLTADGNGLMQTSVLATQAGLRTVTATLNGFAVTGTLLVLPGSPNQAQSSYNANPNQVTADGASQASVTLVLRDAFGNPTPNQAVALSVSGSPLTLIPQNPVTNAAGAASINASSTLATGRTLTLTSGNVSFGVPLSFVPGQVSNATSLLSVTPNAVVADGNAIAGVSLYLADAFNNPIVAHAVNLSASGVNNSFAPAGGTTQPGGVFTSQWSSTQAATKTLVADVGTTTLTAQGIFLPGAPSAATSRLSVMPNSIVADDHAVLTATVFALDVFSNVIPNQQVLWSTGGSNVTLSASASQTDLSGQSNIVAHSPLAQNTSLTAQIGDVVLSQPVTFVAGAPNSVTSQLLLSPNGPLTADGVQAATLTAILRDAYANLVPGITVTFSSSGINNLLTQPTGPTDANGFASGLLASTKAESKTVTLTAGPASLTAGYLFVAGAPNNVQSLLTITPNSIVAGTSATLSATLYDAFHNPVPNAQLSVSGGNAVSVAALSSPSDSAGHVTAQLSSTIAQATSIQVTSGNMMLSAPFQVVAGAADFNHSTLVLSSPNATADNNQQIVVNGHLADSFGNPVPSMPTSLKAVVNRFVTQRYSYGSGSTAQNFVMTVNGPAQTVNFSFPKTVNPGSWSPWLETAPTLLALQSGNNVIFELQTTTSQVNLDKLTFSARDPQQVIEAEGGALTGSASVASTLPGYSGAGYVTLANSTASVSLPFFFSSTTASTYVLLRTSQSADANLTYALNGNSPINLFVGQNSQWTSTTQLPLAPQEGNNVLTIAHAAVPSAVPIYIDQVNFIQRGPNTVIQAETATLGGPAGVGTNVGGYTGTGFVQGMYMGGNVTLTLPITSESFSNNMPTTDLAGNVQSFWSTSFAEAKGLQWVAGNVVLSANATFVAGTPNVATAPLPFLSGTQLVAGVQGVFGVQVKDVLSNPVSGAAVSYASASPNVSVFTASGVTDSLGTSNTAFVGTSTGVRQVCAQIANAYTQCSNVTIVAAAPNAVLSSLTLTPNSVVAGGNVVATASLIDPYGNPVSGVSFSLSGGNTTSVLIAPNTSNASGSANAVISLTQAQNTIIYATSGNATFAASLRVYAAPASAANTTFSLSSSTAIADNVNTIVISGYAFDQFGNPALGQVVSSQAQVTRFYQQRFSNAGGTCTPHLLVNGVEQPIYPRLPSTNGSWYIWALSPAQSVTLVTGNNALLFYLSQGFSNIDSINVSAGDVTVLIEAESGTPSGGASIGSSTTGFTGSGYVTLPVTSPSSLAVNVTPTIPDANYMLGVRFSNAVGPVSANVPISVNGSLIGNLLLGSTLAATSWYPSVLLPASLQQGNNLVVLGGSSPNTVLIDQVVLVQRRGMRLIEAETGTLVGAATVQSGFSGWTGTGFVGSLGSPNNGIIISVPVASDSFSPNITVTSTGYFQGSWTSSVAETKAFTASVGNASLTTNVTFAPAAPVAAQSLLVLGGNATVVAGAPLYAISEIRDALGNPVPNVPVTFSSASPNVSFVPSAVTTGPIGNANANVSTTLAGTQSVCAQVANYFALCANLTAVSASPNGLQSQLLVSPNVAVADNATSVALSGHVADAFGNPVANQTVQLGALISRNFTNRFAMGNQYSPQEYVSSPPTVTQLNFVVPKTNNSWTQWSVIAPMPVLLADGNNLVSAYTTNSSGVAYGANLDSFTFSAADSLQYVEAESGTVGGNAIVGSTLAGYQGSGYVSLAQDTTATISLPFFYRSANANAFVFLRYNTGGSQAFNLSLNGNNITSLYLSYKPTSAATWQYSTLTAVSPVEGNNVVTLTYQSTSAPGYSTQIDQLVVYQQGPNMLIEAESGSIRGNTNVMTTYAGFTGTGYVGNMASSADGVTINVPVTSETFQPKFATTDLNGNFTSLWTSSVAESKMATMSTGNVSLVGNASFVAGAASAAQSPLPYLSATQVVAGSVQTMGVQVKDSLRNNVSGATVSYSPTTPNVAILSSAPLTDGLGTSYASFSVTKAGPAQICAQLANTYSQCANFTVVAGAANSVTSTLSVTPNVLVSGANTLLVSTFFDMFGNPVVGQSINFSTAGTIAGLPTSVVTNSAGSASVGITPTVSQNCVIQASLAPAVLSAPLSIFAGPPNQTKSSISLSANAALANANSSILVSGMVADVYGNPVVGQTVGISSQMTRYLSQRYSVLSSNNSGGRIIRINGVGAPSTCYSFYKTLAPLPWVDSFPCPVTVTSGVNSFYETTSAPYAPSIDYIDLTVADQTQTFEAENGILSGNATVASSQAGYSGSGYVALPYDPNANLALPFFFDSANGNAYVALRYAVTGSVTFQYALNGNLVSNGNVLFAYNNFTYSMLVPIVPLEGNNILSLYYSANGAVGGQLLVDQILILQRGSQQVVQAESGVFGGSVSVQTTTPGFTGTGYVAGFADAGNDLTVPFTISSDTFSPASPTTDANGKFTSQWRSSVAEAKGLTVTAGNVALASSANFMVGTASAATTPTPWLSTSVATVGNFVTFGVQITDALSNSAGNVPISYSSTSPNVSFAGSQTVTNPAGLAHTLLTSTLAGNQNICALVNGQFARCANVQFVAGPPSAATSTLGVSPNMLVANQATTAVVSGYIRDQYGNPVFGQNVGLTANLTRDFVQRYSNASVGSFYGTLQVNNGSTFNVPIPKTNITSAYWAVSPISPLLVNSGVNTISEKFLATNTNADIDYIRVGYGTQIQSVEAESGQVISPAVVASSVANYSGTGYVQIPQTAGAGFTVPFFFESANTNVFLAAYISNPTSFYLNAVLNGNNVGQLICTFAAPGNPFTSTQLLPIAPIEGNNTLQLTFSSAINAGSNILIDKLFIVQPGPSQVIQAENSTLAGSASVQTSISGYSGSGYVTNNAGAANFFTVSLNVASEVFSSNSVSSDQNGFFTATWASSAAESKIVVAAVANFALIANATFTAGTPSSTQTPQVTLSSTQVVVGTPVVMGVQALDALANPVAGVPITYSSTAPNVVFQSSATTYTTVNGGTAHATFSSTATGYQMACSNVNNSFARCGNVIFLAGTPNTALSSFSTTPTTPVAGGNVVLREYVLDSYGNAVSGLQQNLLLRANGANVTTYSATSDVNGVITFTQALNLAANYTISGSGVLASLSSSFSVSPNVPNSLSVSLLRSGLPAGHINDLQVTAFDYYGNQETNASQAGYTLQFTGTDPALLAPNGYAFTASDLGMHAFYGNIRLLTPGNQTITVFVPNYPATAANLSAQVLAPVGSTYRIALTSTSPNQCISPLGNRSAGGTFLTARACSGLYGQVMRLGSDSTVRFLNQCVEAPSGASPLGQNLTLQSCNMNGNQLWSYSGTQIVSTGQPNACMNFGTAAGGGTATLALCSNVSTSAFALSVAPEAIQLQVENDQTNIEITPTSGALKTWYGPNGHDLGIPTTSGRITVDGNLCFDFNNSAIQSGALIVLNSCGQQNSQLWTVDGPLIRSTVSPNLCMDHTGSFNIQVTARACGSSSEQNWALSSMGMLYHLKSANPATPNYCLRTAGNPAGNSTLGFAPCATDYNYIWTISNYGSRPQLQHSLFGGFAVTGNNALYGDTLKVLNFSGRSADDGYGLSWVFNANGSFSSYSNSGSNFLFSSVNGVSLGRPQLVTATGSSAENFYISVPSMTLAPTGAPTLCLTAGSGNTFINQPVNFQSCAGTPGQRFMYTRPAMNFYNEFVMVRLGGLCLDVTNGGAAGSTLLMAPCTGSTTQMWNVYNYSGTPLSNGAGTCLVGGSVTVGQNASVAACSGGSAQNYQMTFY